MPQACQRAGPLPVPAGVEQLEEEHAQGVQVALGRGGAPAEGRVQGSGFRLAVPELPQCWGKPVEQQLWVPNTCLRQPDLSTLLSRPEPLTSLVEAADMTGRRLRQSPVPLSGSKGRLLTGAGG